MPNPEHENILRQGVDKWNTWIEKQSTPPDLHGSDLSGLNLRGAALQNADLENAGLRNADLRGADLKAAKLAAADMTGTALQESDASQASFKGAQLNRAQVQYANLKNADLRDCSLVQTNLSGANLTGARFDDVTFGATTFFQTQLSQASGLSECVHVSDSNLDHHTIVLADPPLPSEFLEGCGIPPAVTLALYGKAENENQYVPALTTTSHGWRITYRVVSSLRIGLYTSTGILLSAILTLIGADLANPNALLTVAQYVDVLIGTSLTGTSGVILHATEDFIADNIHPD